MKCSRIQINLSDYSRGLLSAEESRKIAEHLANCAECRRVLEEERRLADIFASAENREAPRDVWHLVEAGIQTDNKTGLLDRINIWLRVYRRRLAAAAAAVVVICGVSASITIHNNAAEAEKNRAREALAMMHLQIAGVDQQTSTTEAMIAELEKLAP
jgi:anti-sigma-K factor RskA